MPRNKLESGMGGGKEVSLMTKEFEKALLIEKTVGVWPPVPPSSGATFEEEIFYRLLKP